jgi:hypothetical protein
MRESVCKTSRAHRRSEFQKLLERRSSSSVEERIELETVDQRITKRGETGDDDQRRKLSPQAGTKIEGKSGPPWIPEQRDTQNGGSNSLCSLGGRQATQGQT